MSKTPSAIRFGPPIQIEAGREAVAAASRFCFDPESQASRFDRPSCLMKEGRPPLNAHPMREGQAPPSNTLPWGKGTVPSSLSPNPYPSPGRDPGKPRDMTIEVL